MCPEFIIQEKPRSREGSDAGQHWVDRKKGHPKTASPQTAEEAVALHPHARGREPVCSVGSVWERRDTLYLPFSDFRLTFKLILSWGLGSRSCVGPKDATFRKRRSWVWMANSAHLEKQKDTSPHTLPRPKRAGAPPRHQCPANPSPGRRRL